MQIFTAGKKSCLKWVSSSIIIFVLRITYDLGNENLRHMMTEALNRSHQKRMLTSIDLSHCKFAQAPHGRIAAPQCPEKEGTHGSPQGISYHARLSFSPESIFHQLLWFFNQAPDVGMVMGCTGRT